MAERRRLVALAARVLADHSEAEDVVQQAWLRLDRSGAEIESVPAWLTTVVTRLCLDRLRARVPVPAEDPEPAVEEAGPADEVLMTDSVGRALHVVLDRLSPRERVALVLHDGFAYEFTVIAEVLGTTPAAARKLASRARAKVVVRETGAAGAAGAEVGASTPADWKVVDAFMDAARGGDLERLLRLLAPGVVVDADRAAVLVGTPRRIEGRDEVAAFFDGSAGATLPVLVGDRPGSAWFHRGVARVVFDFTVVDGQVHAVTFRADPGVLATVVRREGSRPRR